MILTVQFFVDRPGLREAEQVRSLNQAVLTALHRELTENPPHVPLKGDVSVFNRVVNKRLALRYVLITINYFLFLK